MNSGLCVLNTHKKPPPRAHTEHPPSSQARPVPTTHHSRHKRKFLIQPPGHQDSTQPCDLDMPLGGELYPRLSSGRVGVLQV